MQEEGAELQTNGLNSNNATNSNSVIIPRYLKLCDKCT